ncbi:GntR family transcriptional regulator [Nitrincola schmidtii]|uniref:GntR family transcriptional regulator n=1 Tax=Nitrincola schmidtii TaxID=1730894 RepID=UPI00197D00B1|nr:GntR family transcriptional regulator [Nitrincola schmidtii]
MVVKSKTVTDNQSIYDLMFAAIANRKLPPGLKLSEERLCRVFGVSRTRLREVFFRLAQDRIITLKHNRGAYVTRPTARDATEVFAARRAIEVSVVEQLANSAGAQVIKRLQQHLAEEASARSEKDHARLTQLTGDFHLLLAELSGNSIYHDIVRRLTALSSLIIYLYDSPSASACKDNEHNNIVEAISSGDAITARSLMLEHLEHVEKSLKIDDEEQDDFDIESVFKEMLS